MPDTRSIGMATEPEVRPDTRNTVPEIRSANTGELLETSPMAQAEVELLFNSKKTSKPRVNSEYFKPPREFKRKETQKREMETEGDTNEERDDGAKRRKEDQGDEFDDSWDDDLIQKKQDEGDGFDDPWDDDLIQKKQEPPEP